MSDVKISSDESEGLFNEFIQEQLDEIVDDIINKGDLDRFDDRGSDIIIEMDDIQPPVLRYDTACAPQICGEGVRQIGEGCDDGNLVSGDGCFGFGCGTQARLRRSVCRVGEVHASRIRIGVQHACCAAACARVDCYP